MYVPGRAGRLQRVHVVPDNQKKVQGRYGGGRVNMRSRLHARRGQVCQVPAPEVKRGVSGGVGNPSYGMSHVHAIDEKS